MTPRDIARKIIAFDPGDDASFVAVGIAAPLRNSTVGLTWQHIRALAAASLPKNEKPAKRIAAVKRVFLTRA